MEIVAVEIDIRCYIVTIISKRIWIPLGSKTLLYERFLVGFVKKLFIQPMGEALIAEK